MVDHPLSAQNLRARAADTLAVRIAAAFIEGDNLAWVREQVAERRGALAVYLTLAVERELLTFLADDLIAAARPTLIQDFRDFVAEGLVSPCTRGAR